MVSLERLIDIISCVLFDGWCLYIIDDFLL